ncbi:MAG: hypothetical protein ACR2KK_06410 [Acidimicrobiales bacterium]
MRQRRQNGVRRLHHVDRRLVGLDLVHAGRGERQLRDDPHRDGRPFPGDGSNGPNMLTQSGIVRSDITSSFGSSTTNAGGVPLTINLVILDQSGGCKPMSGSAGAGYIAELSVPV